jgi:hypothetical protein
MALLLTLWPHRAESSETVAALRMVYRQACGDLTDAAWLGGCAAAVRTCKHFPMPVELRDLAEAHAEADYQDQVTSAEQRRIGTVHADIRRLLTAGTVTEEQATANRDRYDRMVSDTLKAIREAGQRVRQSQRADWLHERQANRNRRIADGHWDAPAPTETDD